MRGISKITGYLLSGIFLLSWVLVPGKSWAQVSDKFLNEAKTLAKLEDGFFKKRLNSDLKGAYNYQHPVYKEKISIEEFLYFEGRLVSGYRNGALAHISGGMTPSLEHIKKSSTKRDDEEYDIKKNVNKWTYHIDKLTL